MNFNTPKAARAFLLIALPLSAVAATAQGLRSSVTSFDRFGNPIIQGTSGDPNRSSVTSFDKQGNATITYTSPPVIPGKIIGQTAPNPNPGYYNRFVSPNTTVFRNGYNNYNYPQYGYNYGYPAPIFPPAFPVQQNAYVSGFGNGVFQSGNSMTVIPLTPDYAYPAPNFGNFGYPAPVYGYPVPSYPYPATYPVPYGYGYGNGYGQGSYSSNSTGYGINFGRGGFSASIGGSNTTSRSSTTITVR